MTKILITGASGFIGKALIKHFLAKGYIVNTLTRKMIANLEINSFVWNPELNQIDLKSFENVDVIINLAGENVGEQRWTRARKKAIIDSRIKSTSLLYNSIQKLEKKPSCFINASAIGIYGRDSGLEIQNESSPFGSGFLSEVTQLWENEADKIEYLGIRLIKLRIGVVLSLEGGALPKIYETIKFGIGSGLGSGNQGMSWIHLDDLCQLVIFCIENQIISGPINAVGPNPISNKDFMHQIAKINHKLFFLPNVPSFVLYLILGELADIVVGGNYVSSKKIETFGFKYDFPFLKNALQDIFNKTRSIS